MTSKSRFNKRAFFRDLGYEPHKGQLEVHLATQPRRILASGARWGKTKCSAMEGLAAAMAPAERSVGWICAPTYDLCDRVFREIQITAAERLRHRIVVMKENDRKLVLRNLKGGLSEIQGKSADNPISLLGEGLDWLVVDEASRLKPVIWQAHLSQRLLDRRGWALLISTPKGKNYFYDLYRRGQGQDPDYKSWNYPSWTSPLLDASIIEEERKRLPARVFEQEYGARFIEGAGQVFRGIRESAIGEFEEPIHGKLYFGGLDLAKTQDFTVLVLLDEQLKVVFVDRFHRLDWSLQVNRVKAAADKYNGAVVLVDSSGIGEPVVESLWKAGIVAEPYRFTQRSKSALVDNLALMLEQRQITIPRPELWPEGIDELESFQFSISDAGNVRTGAPTGYHDDCVIALALAAWNRGHYVRPMVL